MTTRGSKPWWRVIWPKATSGRAKLGGDGNDSGDALYSWVARLKKPQSHFRNGRKERAGLSAHQALVGASVPCLLRMAAFFIPPRRWSLEPKIFFIPSLVFLKTVDTLPANTYSSPDFSFPWYLKAATLTQMVLCDGTSGIRGIFGILKQAYYYTG